ncbi:hypothetical protein [Leptolyngbya sp. FACHB-261]|uniref:hypothetical protein n=1 Tax=Leptolyngbya sp. FACHB-261 TaxID=2692806 RepID=UPI0018EF718B|nr:hypothetical protein [Leptolyngbya sp. FACHB-261]
MIVACNEKPAIQFQHAQVSYLEVDFQPPKEKTIIAAKRTDKGRKILAGLIHARQFSPSHTMVVDADDCISKNLAAFVDQRAGNNGWFLNKGYRYHDGDSFVYLKRRNFYRMCGTCNIVRYDLNQLPEHPEYNRGYGYYEYYIAHERVKETLAAQGSPLKPLPFSGAVYMVENGENIYYKKERLYNGILSRFNQRPLNSMIQAEFGLTSLAPEKRLSLTR